jgi:hypothetical protein
LGPFDSVSHFPFQGIYLTNLWDQLWQLFWSTRAVFNVHETYQNRSQSVTWSIEMYQNMLETEFASQIKQNNQKCHMTYSNDTHKHRIGCQFITSDTYVLRASASVSIIKIKFVCHVIKLTIYFKSDIPE